MDSKKLKKRPEPKILDSSLFFSIDYRLQAALLLMISLVFYFNTVFNDFAFDDTMLIIDNTYVDDGFSGIGKILTHGEIDGVLFFGAHHVGPEGPEFSGGRYRPLSIVTFAIERGIFGRNPTVMHITNILIYLLTVFLLFLLLRKYFFNDIPDIAFLAALLFAIHPVHSEVVANIKSRSEEMVLLFSVILFIFTYRYYQSRKLINLAWAGLFLFLSLLSKEYGVMMVVIIPVFFYVICKEGIGKSLLNSIPFFCVVLFYVFIRNAVVPKMFQVREVTEVLNNQYILATFEQALATKIAVLLSYLKIQFFPVVLSCDYSYNEIPFISLTNWKFWISLVIHLALVVLALILVIRRHRAGFFLVFYLANLFIISNIMVEIGTTFSERLIYLDSLAFCVLIAFLVVHFGARININANIKKWLVFIFLSVLTTVCGYIVIERNRIWKNDDTLFTNDVNISRNSALVCGNAGCAFLRLSRKPENVKMKDYYLQQAKNYLLKADRIHPSNVGANNNLAAVYCDLKNYDSVYYCLDKVRKLKSTNKEIKGYAEFFKKLGLKEGAKNELNNAVKYLKWSASLFPGDADTWGNLGGAYYMLHKIDSAQISWEKAITINSKQSDAVKGLMAIKAISKKKLTNIK
jgi:hypothetical protein